MVDISNLKTSIVGLLSAEMRKEASFNADILAVKVELAIREVMAKREYENSSYSDERILAELSTRYYATITNLARYDYAQVGAEGQTSHTENSVSRNYRDRDKLISDVHAFVKVL